MQKPRDLLPLGSVAFFVNMIYQQSLFGKKLIGWSRKWIDLKIVDGTIADKIIIKNHYAGKATKIRMPPTPNVPDLIEIQNGIKTGLKLQPNFVEWRQGFPIGWTDLNA